MEKREDLQLTSERQRSGINGQIMRDRLDHSARVQVYHQKWFREVRVLGVDAVHVLYCTDKAWDVDLVEIQAPDVMKAPLAHWY